MKISIYGGIINGFINEVSKRDLRGLNVHGFNCNYSDPCENNPQYDEIVSILQTNCGRGWCYGDSTRVLINNSVNIWVFLIRALKSWSSIRTWVFLWVIFGFPPSSIWTSGLQTNFDFLNFTLKQKHQFQIPVEKVHANPDFTSFFRASKARCKFSLNKLKLDLVIWRWCCAPGIWRDPIMCFGPTELVELRHTLS